MTRSEAGKKGQRMAQKTQQAQKALRVKKYYEAPKKCKGCSKILGYEEKHKTFCCQSCSTTYNNLKRKRKISFCLNCGNEIKFGNKFCNNDCQQRHQYAKFIENWKSGLEDGTIGRGKTLSTSSHIKRYMKEKYGDSCSRCGFDKKHPDDGKSIIELEHLDGDASNNREENLILLCPNCHALSSTYRGRNKGNGKRK